MPSVSNSGKAPMRPGLAARPARRLLRGAAIGLGVLVLLAGLLVGGLYLYARGDAGLKRLANLLEELASEPGVFSLSIDRVTGDPFGQFAVEGITLGDAEGPWFSLNSVQLDWTPAGLWQRRLTVERLHLFGAELLRLPATDPSAGQDEEETGLPAIPLDIEVENIVMDSIALGPGILGKAALFSGEAALDYAIDGRLRANLVVDLLNDVPGRVSLSLKYDRSKDIFDASMEAFEAAGGLVAGLLAMPDLPSLDVTLQGAGSLSAWKGRLTAQAGPGAALESDIAISGPSPWNVQAKGHTNPIHFLPDDLASLVGDGLHFDLAASIMPDGAVTIDRGDVSASGLAFSVAGSTDGAGEALDLQGRVKIIDSAAIAALLDPLRLARAEFDYAVTGSLQAPALSLMGEVVAPDLDGLKAERLKVSLAAEPDSAHSGSDLRITGQGTLEGFDAGDPDLGQLLDDNLAFELGAGLGLEGQTFRLERLEARQSDFSMVLSGTGGLEPFTAALDAELRHEKLSRLASLAGVPLKGQASGKAGIEIDQAGLVKVEANAAFKGFATGLAELDAFTGPAPVMKARLTLPPQGGMQIQSLSVRGASAAMTGQGAVGGGWEQLVARFGVDLPSLEPLSASLGGAVGGRAKLQGRLDGTLAELGLTATVEAWDLFFDDLTIPSLSAEARLEGLTESPKGRIGLVAASPFGSIDVDSGFAMADSGLIELSPLTVLREGRDRATGRLAYRPETGGLAGDIDIGIADLADWADATGTDLSGPLAGRLLLNPADGKQGLQAVFQGDAISLAGPGAPAGRVDLRAEVNDLFGRAAGRASLEAAGLGLPGGRLTEARMTLSGSLDTAEVALSAKGTLTQDFVLDAAARIKQDERGLSITLPSAEATYGAVKATSTQELLLQRRDGTLLLRGLALAIGGGTVEGEASLDERSVTARLAVAEFPLALMESFGAPSGLQGNLGGNLTLGGNPQSPDGDFRLEAVGLRTDREALAGLPDLAVRMTGKMVGGRFQSEGAIAGLGDEDVTLSVSAPVSFSLDPFAADIPADKPLEARLQWTGRAGRLVVAAGLDRITLSGDTLLDLSVKGSLAAPAVSGRVAITAGRYENFTTGTVLQGLVIEATPQDDRLDIRISGQDESGGTLTGGGSVMLQDIASPQIDAKATLENFRAVIRDDVTANISGSVSYVGSLDQASITGRLTSDVIEVRLIDALPPSVVDLEVIDPDAADQDPDNPRAREKLTEQHGAIDLDVVFTMPQRVFLRGRGLDSEWAGEVRVSGPAGNPQIAGQLSPVRGTFSLVGKRFDLGEGRVSLVPGGDLDPILDLSARHEGDEVATTVHLGGTVSAPKVSYSSEPPLPDEEILSRLLFGRSSAQLSPGEALQLAESAAQLAGGGGRGVMDIARDSLGVDVLALSPGGEGEVGRLKAGKYVADNVFVGVEQGATADSSGATVEVEVTPNFSVETDLGTDRGGSAKLRFKWNY